MTRLNLTPEGKRFHVNLHMLLKYLAFGFTVNTLSCHTIKMSEDGQPGFQVHVTHSDGTEYNGIMQIGYDVAWQQVFDYAKAMTEAEWISMAANIALNSKD